MIMSFWEWASTDNNLICLAIVAGAVVVMVVAMITKTEI